MTVARWQRLAVALQLCLLGLWLGGWARLGWVAAACAFVCVPLLVRLPLALQFLLATAQMRQSPGSHPAAWQWLRAWWSEGAWSARVFGWWQPFRLGTIADSPQVTQPGRGVVLVHGFGCNRGFWMPWLRCLRNEGRAFVAVTLEPPLASIDHYASVIDAAVRCVRDATGMPPLIVAHSMGGLAVRAWLRAVPGADADLYRVVTLGTPHQGTWAARFAWGVNGRQMRPDSDWLRELAAQEPPERRARFICWQSDCDNVVYPRGVALLPGALAHHLSGLGHVQMAFDAAVMRACRELLDA